MISKYARLMGIAVHTCVHSDLFPHFANHNRANRSLVSRNSIGLAITVAITTSSMNNTGRWRLVDTGGYASMLPCSLAPDTNLNPLQFQSSYLCIFSTPLVMLYQSIEFSRINI
jgi:hypothetical protein